MKIKKISHMLFFTLLSFTLTACHSQSEKQVEKSKKQAVETKTTAQSETTKNSSDSATDDSVTSVTYTNEHLESELEIKETLKAKNNKLIEQLSEARMPFSVLKISSKEEAQKMFEPKSTKFENAPGIVYAVEYKDNYVIEKYTIDFTQIDDEDLKMLSFFTKNTTLDEATKTFEEQELKKIE